MEDTETSETLQKFFEKASKNCTCNFNAILFKSVLSEYIGLRLKVHRERKNHGRVHYALMNQITMARHRVEFLAPCSDCVARLNPTGRTKPNLWNPHRKRAYRECVQ